MNLIQVNVKKTGQMIHNIFHELLYFYASEIREILEVIITT